MKRLLLIVLIGYFILGFFITENALAQLYESQSYTPVVVPAPPGTTGLGTYETVAGPAGMTYLVENYREEENIDSIPNAKYSNVGDIYIGPSGTIYKLKPLPMKEQEALENTGLVIIGFWMAQGEKENTP